MMSVGVTESVLDDRASSSASSIAPSGIVHWSAMWPTGMLARQGTRTRSATSRKHVVERRAPAFARIVGNLGELAERDAGDAMQRAAQPQLREHAVDAIDRFVHVLEDEDRAVVDGRVRRAAERGERARDCRRRVGRARDRRGASSRSALCRTIPSPSTTAARSDARLNVGEMAARRRAVIGHEVRARVRRGVQRGDVGVADERLGSAHHAS